MVSPPLELLVEARATRWLRAHVSLYRPDDADGGAWVPRLLLPAGTFVTLSLSDLGGRVLAETTRPKAKPKLRPDDDASYLLVEPGYSYGAVLGLDLGEVSAGEYRLDVGYTSDGYPGTADRPVGDLSLGAQVPVLVGD